jgi:signal peptidase I
LGCFGWLLFIGIFLFIVNIVIPVSAVPIKTYVCELFVLHGMAMAPTLIAPSEVAPEVLYSDRVVVNKLIYRMSDPQRGDIVIYKSTNSRDGSLTNHIHRIVGLPGETIDIDPPYVLIDGKRLTDPPIFAKIASGQDGFTGYCTAQDVGAKGVPLPLTLGSDEYFLLGDNAPVSKDSRFVGPILRQDITGKVIRIFYPFDRIRDIE